MNEVQNPLENPNDLMENSPENVSTPLDTEAEQDVAVMSDNSMQPRSDDAVLGGQSQASMNSEDNLEQPRSDDAVLGGQPQAAMIAELQQQLASQQQEIAQQTEELEGYKKRYITLAAEFDNYRKRTQREQKDLEKQVKRKTIIELLSVVDNFERARTQLKPSNDGEMEIHKSYQSVYKSFADSLKRLGVSPMRPEGQLFDPNYHEAMLREPTNDHPEGTVIEELVRGYLLEDQVLRHSMVKVAAPQESVIPSDKEQADPQETSNSSD